MGEGPLDGVWVLGVIAVVAYTVRGITGAVSAIVFNALFGAAISLDLVGDLRLLDGLYWIALADFVAATTMVGALRRTLTLEPFLVRFIAVGLPANIACTLLLPSIALPLLGLGLGLALIGSGFYLAGQQRFAETAEQTLLRWATPAGVGAGVVGGLFGMGGTVSVLYVSHAGGDPLTFRRRMTVVSIVSTSVRATVLVAAGAFDEVSLARFAMTIPFILVGLAFGMRIQRHIRARLFRMGLGGLIALAGFITVGRFLDS